MAAVTLIWTQRAAGRWPGTFEVTELTPFIQGCIDNSRCYIVKETLAPVAVPAVVTPEESHAEGMPPFTKLLG